MKKFTTVLTLITATSILALSGCSSAPVSESYEASSTASTDVPSEVPTELPTSETPNAFGLEPATAEEPSLSTPSSSGSLMADASGSSSTMSDASPSSSSPVDLGASSAGRSH